MSLSKALTSDYSDFIISVYRDTKKSIAGPTGGQICALKHLIIQTIENVCQEKNFVIKWLCYLKQKLKSPDFTDEAL